jgi:hypothetical protein
VFYFVGHLIKQFVEQSSVTVLSISRMEHQKVNVYEVPGDFFTLYKIVPGPVLGHEMSGEVVLARSPTHPTLQFAVKRLSLLTPDGGIRNMEQFKNEVPSKD